MKKNNPLRKIFYTHNKFNLTMAIIGTTILSVAILLMPQLTQLLFDYISGDNSINIKTIIIFAACILSMEIGAGFLTYFFRTKFSTKAVHQYRVFAYDYLSNTKVSDFYSKNTSVYLSSLTNDINRIKNFYLDLIPIISQIILCGLGAIVIMMRYNFFLALISVGISFIPFFAALVSGREMPKAEEILSDRNAEYMSFLKDYSIGYPIIKSYKAGKVFSKLHIESSSTVSKAMLNRERNLEKINYFAAVSSYITRFGVLFVSSYFAVVKGAISSGTVIAFLQLIMYIIDPFSELPSILSEARSSLALSDKFWNEIQNKEIQKGESSFKVDGNIKIDHLSFKYSEDKMVLSDISLNITKGEKIAIIGASGSGKSTLLKLILGILKPSKGNIYMSGIDILDVNEDELFKQISYIQQDVFIFNGSIFDNITLFQNYNGKDIDEAIEKSGLKELVKEKSLDYICGENGSNLSGGEKQRICVARSLLRKTKLFIADEITAPLDNETSYSIMKSILDIRDSTEIVILHHFDQRILSRFDNIYALKSGKLVESGNFDYLLSQKGYFYSLYKINNI